MTNTISAEVKEYNYCSFKPKYYNLFDFRGPKPGEKAVDFEAFDLDGNKVKLSDYFGSWLVLETGSFSCPMYVGNIKKMNELYNEFKDVTFLVLYVREAHPGSNVPSIVSIKEKLQNASRLPGEENERRKIFVDTIDGHAHKLYGSFPNSVYVINPEGTIIFRSDWNIPSKVKKVLTNGRDEIHERDHYEPGPPSIPLALRVLMRSGLNALWDFTISLPELLTMHKNVDKAYEQKNK